MSLFLEALSNLNVGRERAQIVTFYREVVASPRAFTMSEVEASVSWISAMCFKGLAGKETRSKSIQFILGKMRLPITSSVNIHIPHYWAPYYHDGPGPRVPSKKKFFLVFPKGQDPRRPRSYRDEIDPSNVKSMHALGPGALRMYKKLFGDRLKFFKVRKGWKGDRFFDRTEQKYGRQISDLVQIFLEEIFVLWGDHLTEEYLPNQMVSTRMGGLLSLIWRIVYRKSSLRA